MKPPFWLKVTPHYVIENFEALIQYVKAYDFQPEEENPEGDFLQTYKALKELADQYKSFIDKIGLRQKPEFDIPVEKVIRILAVAILTGRKIGTDDYDSVKALVNLLILNNPTISAQTESDYFEIVRNCLAKAKILNLGYSWSDVTSESSFQAGILETKLADMTFCEPDFSQTSFLYENHGALLIDENGFVLRDLNSQQAQGKKLSVCLHPSTSLTVKTHNISPIPTVQSLIEQYPRILGSFDSMPPTPTIPLKKFNDSESFLVKITSTWAKTIQAVTISTLHQKESGKIWFGNDVALIPKDKFIENLTIDDLLLVKRNKTSFNGIHFSFDRTDFFDFVGEVAEDIRNSEEDVEAVFIKPFQGGTRWVCQYGFCINIFDNTLDDEEQEAVENAIKNFMPVKIRIISLINDTNGNIVINGKFINVSDIFPEEKCNPGGRDEFIDQAYNLLIKVYVKRLKEAQENEKPKRNVQNLLESDIHLLGILSAQLAIKQNRDNSFTRISTQIVAAILLNMANNKSDMRCMRTSIDYQRAIAEFAQGHTAKELNVAPVGSDDENSISQLEVQIVNNLRLYKEVTDGHSPNFDITRTDELSETIRVVKDLVNASNILFGKIDISEVNRIKRSICQRLGVEDLYCDIYSEHTNYGTESEFLEFKASCVLPPANRRTTSLKRDINLQKWNILKAVCAFLNTTTGGELLIGVADSGFASGIKIDAETLFKERLISDPNADRLRTYLKSCIDKSFETVDKRVSGIAITAGRVECLIEKTKENLEIIRIKVSPYPWDVVRINLEDKPEGFSRAYVRTSGASTPLDNDGIRSMKLKKFDALDKSSYKIKTILQSIDNQLIVEIKNYSGGGGLSLRRVEPFKVLPDNKSFLGFDISRKDMRLFKFSRFDSVDIKVTTEKWKNQKKHHDRELDLFGMVEDNEMEPVSVKLKLSDYAKNLVLEECRKELLTQDGPHTLTNNTVTDDRKNFPWILSTNVNNLAGVARFVMGLPKHVKIEESQELIDFIDEIRSDS